MSNDLTEIGITRKEAEESIKLAEHLEKLHKNASFRKVILEGFLEQEAVRAAPLLAQPLNDHSRKGVVDALTAIGVLRNYFGTIYRKGDASVTALEECDQVEAELLDDDIEE